MAKNKFDFKAVEEKWKEFWKKEGIYKFNPDSNKKIYSVDTPPPNVSGRMHIGHACSYSQQDFIVRYMRMKGFNIFYPFGTDDNGLPTERFIEKQNKIKSKNLGRAEFVKLCQETLKDVTPGCIKDFVDLGISSDYDLFYSTIDNHAQKVSQKSFIDLYKQGDVYQKDFPTMWCTECETSIAQAELEDKEQSTLFSTVKFNLDEEEDLLVATTRPELLAACLFIVVNPKDERYKHLVGKKAMVPLFDYEVPILEDSSADPEKGTGVLMICSYGDKDDVDAVMRYNKEPRIIFNKDGTLNEMAGKYSGLKIKEARDKILEDLKEKGLVTKQDQIQNVVNSHDKCGNPIEFIPTEQWFINLLDKREDYLKKAEKVNWNPEFMHKRYENWVNGLEWDWSISRNRHFGVPIPVWKCPDCNEIILPSEGELPVDPLSKEKECSKCKKRAIPESRVLDTWATSSLTPQISASLPGAKNKIKLPFSLRPNAHDIIRTWAFYTIVKSHLHEDKIPWKDIIVSGIVSLGGEKMSKSNGNVVDPVKIMNEYGSDSLRFWASASKLGKDLDYQEKYLVTGKKLINKISNASKFVFMNLEDYNPNKNGKPEKLQEIDEIFLNKLNNLIIECTKAFDNYEYAKAKNLVEHFFWEDFADNYIEIVKKRVYHGEKGSSERLSAQYTLYNSLFTIIKLFAPIMPFITEDIYQTYFKGQGGKGESEKSIHISSWPETIKLEETENSSSLWENFVELLSKVRQEKSNHQKPMNSEIILSLNKEDILKFKGVLEDLKNVTNSFEIKEGEFKVNFKEL